MKLWSISELAQNLFILFCVLGAALAVIFVAAVFIGRCFEPKEKRILRKMNKASSSIGRRNR